MVVLFDGSGLGDAHSASDVVFLDAPKKNSHLAPMFIQTLFSSSFILQHKLVYVSGTHFRLRLIFASRAGAYLSDALYSNSPYVLLLTNVGSAEYSRLFMMQHIQ